MTSNCEGSRRDTIFYKLMEWLMQKGEKGSDFLSCAVVFPGKRPAFYLRKMLGETLKRPFIPPNIFDVDSFIGRLAGLYSLEPMRRDASTTELLYLLYKTAEKVGKKGIAQDFESFFPWGLRLLEVFDEFGAGLVTPEKIDNAVPLALKDAGLGEDVCGLWPLLPKLYRAWMDSLGKACLWTRGEKYRLAVCAIQRLVSGGSDLRPLPAWLEAGCERIGLAGFYAPTKAEEEIFSALCGMGSATMIDEDIHPDIASHPRLFFHPCSDLHSQISTAVKFFKGRQQSFNQQSFPPDEEVIVLPDPNALIPVLEWLIGVRGVPFNISMGYPLEHTPPARLLGLVLDAQEGREGGGYHTMEYLNVLRHPYIKGLGLPDAPDTGNTMGDGVCFRGIVHWIEAWIAKKRPAFVDCEEVIRAYEDEGGLCADFLKEIHKKLFLDLEKAGDVKGFASSLFGVLDLLTVYRTHGIHPLTEEFISSLTEFLESLLVGDISSEPITANGFRFLFRYLIQTMRIPFSGLPLYGLQVLGMLETRCLSFKKVMVFDVNEGVLPPDEKINPILPPGLKHHLGLPDSRKAAEISRHYLYRLISSAEEVHLFFSEGGENVRSRFIEEIIWEKEKRIKKIDEPRQKKPLSVAPPCLSPVSRPKDGVLGRLSSFVFSSTSIDTYLACPFRFYARFCLGIKENNSVRHDAMGPDVIGMIIHRILKEVYEPWLDKEICPGMARAGLELFVDGVLCEEFGGNGFDSLDVSVRLLREVILYRLGHLLELERDQRPTLLGLEKGCETEIELNNGNKVRLKGVLDRVERDGDGVIWVIDYKTGDKVKIPSGDMSGGFERETLKRTVGSFQLPFYLILCDKAFSLSGDWTRTNAAIYELNGIGPETRIKDLKKTLFEDTDDRAGLMEGFYIPAIKSLISEILDPKTPFSPDPSDPSYCGFCLYRHGLCKAVRLPD